MRGETRRKARRCIHRRSIAARIAAKTTGAAAQGAGEGPSPRAPRRTPEGAMRGFVSGRSRDPPKRSGVAEGDVNQGCGTFLGAADSTGPRPDGVYVYAKRPRGRRSRPLRKAMIYARRVEKVRIVENSRDQARLNRVSIAFERRRVHDRAADRAKSRFEKITAAQGRKPAKTSNC